MHSFLFNITLLFDPLKPNALPVMVRDSPPAGDAIIVDSAEIVGVDEVVVEGESRDRNHHAHRGGDQRFRDAR